MEKRSIQLPLNEEAIDSLCAGDQILLSGPLYVARDAAHARMADTLARGEELPVDLTGQVIYYMGPSPAPPGKVMGAAGPTTSHRMDKYTPALLDLGLRGMIGKGDRTEPVRQSIRKNRAVYFAAVGGAGALLSKAIRREEVLAYEDLGAEALRKLEVADFPVIVVIDADGENLYHTQRAQYAGARRKETENKEKDS